MIITDYISSSANTNAKIAVRSCLPSGEPNTLVLLLHGATLPSVIFALPSSENQHSLMAYLASLGCAAYAIDFRGYGLSSKPQEMDDTAMAGPPLIDHQDAAADVVDVLQLIKHQHPNKPIVLCGFSWGSSISGYLAANNNAAYQNWISKLILLGPVYSYPNSQWQELADPNDPTKLNPGIKSYRVASSERWCGLWERELRAHDAFSWRDPRTLEMLVEHIASTDAKWAENTQNQRCIRIPTGVLADALRTYNQDPIYDAAAVKCPTLVLRGIQDSASLSADADGLMDTLRCSKQRIDIADATHYGILERGAARFFQAIGDFAI